MKPMLCETAQPNNLEHYLTNENWWAQPKLDGHRVLFVVTDGHVTPLNRSGERFKNRINKEVLGEFSGEQFGSGTWIFDTEYMHEVDQAAYVFDLIQIPTGELIDKPYWLRHQMLETLFTTWAPFHIHPVPTAITEHGKREMLAEVEAAGNEGLIFKEKNSRYWPGRRSDESLKWKLTKEADLVVTQLWREGKRSVGLGAYDVDGTLIDVGACSMSEKNLARLHEGDTITVRYLYFGAGNRVYQPAFVRVRTDKAAEECRISQLQLVNKIPTFKG